MPFDWDNIPRASGVGDLGGWKGFRGMSGDLVKNVIRELHPYAQVDFRAKPDTQMGPPTRKISHGYLVSGPHPHGYFMFYPARPYLTLRMG